MKRISQVAAWSLALIIVMLSLAPASSLPGTGASRFLEHLMIFFATGVAFGVGYEKRFWILVVGLWTFAGFIEIAQFYAPGRHPRISDFWVNSAAVLAGIGVAFIVSVFKRQHQRVKGSDA